MVDQVVVQEAAQVLKEAGMLVFDETARGELDTFFERMAELELALEDRDWLSLSGTNERAFSRDGLRTISRESYLFYKKNPLVRRAARLQADYVFGQGVSIRADSALVDEVLQRFMEDKKNKKALTEILKMWELEQQLQIDANLFFVFFRSGGGSLRVRLIPFDQIEDIHCNPDDEQEPQLYLRKWVGHKARPGFLRRLVKRDAERESRMEWYPDWDYRPDDRPATFDGKKIRWDEPIFHVKVNATVHEKFGTSELYATQDWAAAYNKFLENWSTIVRAYAKFAWSLTTKGGRKSRAAAKAKLDSQISADGLEPAPSAGSTWIQSEGVDMKPFRTAGATTSAEDGRRLLLMVCAATGWPETFFGDVSVGTLATAKSLDRPSELKCTMRQLLWSTVWEQIGAFVAQESAEHGYESEKHGKLSGRWEPDPEWAGEEVFVFDPDRDGEPIDTHVSAVFPPLVEHDQKSLVESIATAATLDGNPLAGTLDRKAVTEHMLRALGETSIEEEMDRLFPEGETPEAGDVRDAVADLQQAIEALSESFGADREQIVSGLAGVFVKAFQEAARAADETS